MSDLPEGYSILNEDEHGIGGMIRGEIKWREQDKVAEPHEYFAVVFFPKIDLSFKASLEGLRLQDTISNSSVAAVTKFIDGMRSGGTWEKYENSGWRIRRILVTDLGDA